MHNPLREVITTLPHLEGMPKGLPCFTRALFRAACRVRLTAPNLAFVLCSALRRRDNEDTACLDYPSVQPADLGATWPPTMVESGSCPPHTCHARRLSVPIGCWQNNPFYKDLVVNEGALNALPTACAGEEGAPLEHTISEDIAAEPAHVPTSHIGDATYENNEAAVRRTVQLLPPQQTPDNVEDLVELLGAFVTMDVTTRTPVRTSRSGDYVQAQYVMW